MKDKALEIKNLSVNLAGINVLQNINFSLDKGEVAALVGPNGAGKSTLIKAVLGLVSYKGEIKILGRGTKAKSSYKVGYVPQYFSFDLEFPLTVNEFLSFNPKSKDEKDIDKALKEVEMFQYKDKKLAKLSGGQKQRVLIAQAILSDPELLFLDEPTTGIDASGEKGFYEIIEHLNKVHGTTIIMSSHELSMIYKYADKVICLNQEMYCSGNPSKAITKDVLERLYGKDTELKPHTH
ncbi:MAG: metal ABC transporter ATP-binding protein [Parcubacteria group bacterium]